MPRHIHIEKLEPGIVLAVPLMNRYGQVLLQAGSELTVHHLPMLKTWGIKSVLVREGENGERPEPSEDFVKKSEEQIYSRMNWKPRNDFEKDLVQMTLTKILNYDN